MAGTPSFKDPSLRIFSLGNSGCLLKLKMKHFRKWIKVYLSWNIFSEMAVGTGGRSRRIFFDCACLLFVAHGLSAFRREIAARLKGRATFGRLVRRITPRKSPCFIPFDACCRTLCDPEMTSPQRTVGNVYRRSGNVWNVKFPRAIRYRFEWQRSGGQTLSAFSLGYNIIHPVINFSRIRGYMIMGKFLKCEMYDMKLSKSHWFNAV